MARRSTPMNSVNDVMQFTSSNYHSPSPEYFDGDEDERRGRQLSPQPWRFQDPRGSSTHSLLPTDELTYVPSATPTRDARCSRDNKSSVSVASIPPHGVPTHNRRTLLIIYIHGFLGDTTSFKSFPAHVHGYLTKKLRETHVVHTKLYPRYKSYRPLPTAREEFSKWLAPHLENDGTGEKDVVLVGHSMGGMLAAEVVLLPPLKPSSTHPLRHRILGHISCDSPFLSLHPNLVVSGLKSLIPGRKPFDEETETPNAPSLFDSPDPSSWPYETPSPLPSPYPNPNKPTIHSPTPSLQHEESPSHTPPNPSPIISSASSAVSTDPTFNPPFWNDITYPYRGIWRTVAHFSKKYDYRPSAIASATLQQMCENASYAGCLFDVPNLLKRYKRIRELETQNNRHRVRVRWANFYTVCSGERIAAVKPDLKNRNEGPHGPQDAKLLSKTEVKREIGNGTVSGTWGGLQEEIGLRQRYIGTVENDGETVSLGDRGEGEQSDTTPRISISDWSLSREEINGAAGLSDLYESEVEESRSNSSSLVGENRGIINAGAQTLTRPASAPPTASTKSLDIIGQGHGSVGSSAEHKPTGHSTPRTQLGSAQNLRKSHNAVSQDQQFEYDTDTKIRLELAQSELETMTRGRQYCGNQNSEEIHRLKGLIRDLETQLSYSKSHPPSLSNSITGSRIGSPEKGNHTRPKSPSFKPLAKPGAKKEAKKHTRKFCLLPTGAEMDHTWIKVDMGDVDEVNAHCGLFKSESAHYRDFLGVFCEKVVEWVEEDAAARAATLRV